MLNKSSGKPLERLGTSRVTFTFDDSSLAFRPFTAIHCSSLHEEEVTVEKERFHFLPDELRTAYQWHRRQCSMYVLFRRCSHGPLKERDESREGAAVNYIEWRAMSSVMEHCGSPRIWNEGNRRGGKHCVVFGINESALTSCAISSCCGREEGLKCRWKIGSTLSESLFWLNLNQNIWLSSNTKENKICLVVQKKVIYA